MWGSIWMLSLDLEKYTFINLKWCQQGQQSQFKKICIPQKPGISKSNLSKKTLKCCSKGYILAPCFHHHVLWQYTLCFPWLIKLSGWYFLECLLQVRLKIRRKIKCREIAYWWHQKAAEKVIEALRRILRGREGMFWSKQLDFPLKAFAWFCIEITCVTILWTFFLQSTSWLCISKANEQVFFNVIKYDDLLHGTWKGKTWK